jgi:alpha-1,2-mannosyltransferase
MMSSSEILFPRALRARSAALFRLLDAPFLREAHWLTARRLNAYAAILIAASAGMILLALSGHGLTDPRGRPVGTDFVSFWTVSWALHDGRQHAIYIPRALAALEEAVLGSKSASFYAWQYPPIALLVVYPLALLPYLYALGAWLGAGLAGYLSVLWRILPRRLTLYAGLAFPAVLMTILHGQNAFLTVSLFGWGLLLLRQRPVAAGGLLGVLAFKPQLGVLVPVALVAGGHWRAIVAAMLTILGLSAASTLLFGSAIWSEFLAGAPLAGDILNKGLVFYYKMQSVFAAVRLLGGSLALAYSLQALVAAIVAALVAWAWTRRADPELQSAALLAATPLATPFFLDYDLMVIAPAILWLAKKGIEGRALPWERTVLAAAAMAPLLSRPLGQYTDLLLAPMIVAALFAAIMRRLSTEASA